MGHCDLVGFQTEIDAANFPRDLRKECGMLSPTFSTGGVSEIKSP